MGYRSEVRGVIYGNPSEVDSFLVEFAEDYKTVEGDTDTLEVIEYNSYKLITMHSDYCKWYEDYPVVQAWDNLMKNAKKQGLHYEFIRIGDDSDDVVQVQSVDSEGLLQFSRSIEALFE